LIFPAERLGIFKRVSVIFTANPGEKTMSSTDGPSSVRDAGGHCSTDGSFPGPAGMNIA